MDQPASKLDSTYILPPPHNQNLNYKIKHKTFDSSNISRKGQESVGYETYIFL